MPKSLSQLGQLVACEPSNLVRPVQPIGDGPDGQTQSFGDVGVAESRRREVDNLALAPGEAVDIEPQHQRRSPGRSTRRQ